MAGMRQGCDQGDEDKSTACVPHAEPFSHLYRCQCLSPEGEPNGRQVLDPLQPLQLTPHA